MGNRADLEQRQFALERLAQEGKSVCQARANNEVVLFQAVEDEIDNEAGTPEKPEPEKVDLQPIGQENKGVGEVLPDKEFIIYENEYETARIVLDAITAICLSDWLEQLKELGVNDSLTWKFVQNERQAKKNEIDK